MKINFSNFRASKDRNPWLNELAKEFLNEHDIASGTNTRVWFRTREGSRCFVEWLAGRNWQVAYWELPPLKEDNKEVYIAYGIEVKEDCPEFIAYKLKM
jgi:hypothetical protein